MASPETHTRRDVLVPLAAETSALIIGRAYTDAPMLSMFAR